MSTETEAKHAPEAVRRILEGQGYVADTRTATVAYLAGALDRPLLIEGPAGVGKTELGVALAAAEGRELIRLQCYEGLDESKAVYEWAYGKQLLYVELLKDRLEEVTEGATSLAEAARRVGELDDVFFSERFLLPRPLLRAIRCEGPALLLIDEVDKAEPEFEALLLEVLADFALSIPEVGTVKATRRPRVVLTSNDSRELSDALRRRCLHLFLDFPTPEREEEILRSRIPGLEAGLAASIAAHVARIRTLDLRKLPSVAETIEWARALLLLGGDALEPQLVRDTLDVLLKHEEDRDQVVSLKIG
ncbi:MAG: MoxR family ATPase [Deltaproteobacteria bacterium]|nr:MoxR family ATPase [Deltaproteobacteria bacterium]